MEKEAKFIVPDEETFARLKAAESLGVYERRDSKIKTVRDRYVDTEDRRFYGRGLYVRLRAGGDALLLTVKRFGDQPQGAIHERDEYELKVEGLDPTMWTEGEVRQMVLAVAGDMPLHDLAVVEQTRTVSILHLEAHAIAELSLDEVTIPGAGESAKAYEAEVELLSEGAMSDLEALSDILSQEYNLSPQPLSKFERALLLSSPSNQAASEPSAEIEEAEPEVTREAKGKTKGEKRKAKDEEQQAIPPTDKAPDKSKERIGVMPTDSMTEAGLKLLRAHFGVMLANKDGTRSGDDPDAVHDMRVSSRRMRAVLRVMEPYMAGQGPGLVRRGLRSVTRALGAVRDLDVLIGHAEEFRAELPADQQPDMDGLLDQWREARGKELKTLRRLLNSKDYKRFTRGMTAFLDNGVEKESKPSEDGGVPTPFQVRHVAASAVWGRYETVRAFETVEGEATIEQLHELRIRGKYLRYTLECFRETLPQHSKELIGDIVRMQDQLGALHDADVAASLVRDYLGNQKPKGKKKAEGAAVPPGLAAYIADLEASMQQAYTGFFSTWANLSSAEWRARLAGVVAAV